MAKKKAVSVRKNIVFNKIDFDHLGLIEERAGTGSVAGALRWSLRQICPDANKPPKMSKRSQTAALKLGENNAEHGEPRRQVFRLKDFDVKLIEAIKRMLGVDGQDEFDSTAVRYSIRESVKQWKK